MRIIVFAALLLLIKPLFAQELIYNSPPKKGIYKNFYEFKYNRPSKDFNYNIIEKPFVALVVTGNPSFYFLDIAKEDTVELIDVYGFCDGSNIYLNLGAGIVTRKSGFTKLEYIGRYCFYNTSTTYWTGTFPAGFMTSSIIKNVLDAIDGTKFPLVSTLVDDMIKDDPALLEAFQNERSKECVAKDYIVSYCEDNFDRHIIKPLVNDSSLCKLETDTSFKAYYQRIIDFKIDTTIIDIELREYYYGKSKLKMIGLKAKHKRGKNEDYYYKIGAWRTYHKNGNLKSIVNYDFREKMNGRAQFIDKDGMLIEEKYFIHGKVIE